MEKENSQLSRLMTLTSKAVIVKNNGEVLLLKRSKKENFNKNKWDLPGGTLEKGETIKESLIRELKEETGLDIELGPILKVSEFSKDNENFKDEKRGLRFLAYFKSGQVKLDKKEHCKHLWLPIEEAINRFSKKDGFENEKRETLIKAKKYLEMQESEDRWKRALADLDNYKKRVVKNNEEFKKYCLEDFVLDLLPVIDNFEMAIEHAPEEDKNNNWMTGILHIQKQLRTVLNEKGVEKIPVKKGDKIDEKIHEVISGKSKKGKVRKVLKAGYKMGERIIRPATVEIE